MNVLFRLIAAWALVALACVGPVPAWAAQDPIAAAQAARSGLIAATRDLQQAEEATDRVAALTGVVRAYDRALAQVREGLLRISVREKELSTALDARSEDTAALLGVLQTMRRTPGPVMLLHPNGPQGAARGAMLLTALTPELEADAQHLRAELDELAALRATQTEVIDALEAGLVDATRARTELSAAISDRRDLPRRYADDPVQRALLESSASTLSGLAEALADLGGVGDLPRPGDLRGTLPQPVAGRVVAGFGERAAPGSAINGLHIATAPRALVSIPIDATVRFSGPLLDFGTVVVIEPAADVLMIFAGLAEVYGREGEVVPAGTPLGLMGGAPQDLTEILSPGGGEPRPETLYIEVRENGTAVDPASWFVLELQEASTP